MSVFEQVGRRVDGRLFVVDAWLSRSVARVSHDDGSTERIDLAPAERASIQLVAGAALQLVREPVAPTGFGGTGGTFT